MMCFDKSRPYIIIGCGGHASVVHDMLLTLGLSPYGVVDRNLKAGETWEGLPVLGDDDFLAALSPEAFVLVNGLGASPHCTTRNALYLRFRSVGFSFLPLVHPSAVVAHNVALEEGCQIMAGSVLQSGVEVGENSVVNTRASIDHHSRIARGAFVSPGAILCGGVAVGKDVFIGAGAVLLPGVRVGARAVIGAGAVVLRDVPENSTARGNPARIFFTL